MSIKLLNKIFGFAGGVEPKQPGAKKYKFKVDSDELTAGQVLMLEQINIIQEMTSVHMAKVLGFTPNHCSISMADLYRRGLVDREMKQSGSIRFYSYLSKNDAS